MREIKYIVIHCTATAQNTLIASIQKYWKEVMKWKSPGYHHLIDKDGIVHNLSDIKIPTNGVAGYNQNSIHISYIGGVDAKGKGIDNRTPKQKEEMKKLVVKYKAMFPKAEIKGHRDFSGVKKECPSFDVKKWLADENI